MLKSSRALLNSHNFQHWNCILQRWNCLQSDEHLVSFDLKIACLSPRHPSPCCFFSWARQMLEGKETHQCWGTGDPSSHWASRQQHPAAHLPSTGKPAPAQGHISSWCQKEFFVVLQDASCVSWTVTYQRVLGSEWNMESSEMFSDVNGWGWGWAFSLQGSLSIPLGMPVS